MGLGPYPEVTLADAREKALDARRLVKVERRDPLAERGRAKALTFKAAAEALIEGKRPGWRNAKHAAQWAATLASLRLSEARRPRREGDRHPAVLDVLRPIWTEKPETASRVRQRIEAVLDYAAAMGAARATILLGGAVISTTCCRNRQGPDGGASCRARLA